MDITYQLQGIEFEGNKDKAKGNIKKPDVTFEEAAEVFLDPFYVAGGATMDNEERDFIIGYTINQRLLLAVYLERGARIRVISGRPVTRSERKLYEEA